MTSCETGLFYGGYNRPYMGVMKTQIGDNYVGSKPLTFTVRRAFDAYEQYSTGFKSNGVFYAWADFPDGFTYTVSDIDSAIAFAALQPATRQSPSKMRTRSSLSTVSAAMRTA